MPKLGEKLLASSETHRRYAPSTYRLAACRLYCELTALCELPTGYVLLTKFTKFVVDDHAQPRLLKHDPVSLRAE